MKKIYQNPSVMVVALNTRQIICTSDPQPPVNSKDPVGDDTPTYTKSHSVWDDEDWD